MSTMGSAKTSEKSVCKIAIAVTDPTAVITWSAPASIKVLDMQDSDIRNLTIILKPPFLRRSKSPACGSL